jgi:hypothetical protein
VRIVRMLDPSPRRKEVTDSYCANDGRPGIHPEMAVRLMLAGPRIAHERRTNRFRLYQRPRLRRALRNLLSY